MRTEDTTTAVSTVVSSLFEYVNQSTKTELASAVTGLAWLLCGASILVFGSAILPTIGCMIGSYVFFRVIGHMDSSSELSLKTGRETERVNHAPEGTNMCVECLDEQSYGEMQSKYSVYYLFNYEVLRTPKSEKFVCETCTIEESNENMNLVRN